MRKLSDDHYALGVRHPVVKYTSELTGEQAPAAEDVFAASLSAEPAHRSQATLSASRRQCIATASGFSNPNWRPLGVLSCQFQEHQRLTVTVEDAEKSASWLADADPTVSLEVVRRALGKPPGTIARVIHADREERWPGGCQDGRPSFRFQLLPNTIGPYRTARRLMPFSPKPLS